jgi:hypothetical protein
MNITTHIRQCEALNQARMAKEPILRFKPNSHGAVDYASLAKEFLSQCAHRDKLEGQNTKLAEHTDRLRNHPIVQDDDHEGIFFNIGVSMISTDPDQPRKHFDSTSLA